MFRRKPKLTERDFLAAAWEGDMSAVKRCLQDGVSVNCKVGDIQDGSTPLWRAANQGHLDVVSKLLSAGAGVNIANNNGSTPLYIAAWGGHLEVVIKLLAAGAGVNIAKKDGYTPLLVAGHNGHLEVVSKLLAAGAGIDIANNTGVTPLYIAAERGHAEVVSKLLAAGAGINIARNDGCTPLFIAGQNGHLEVVSKLLGAGASVNTPWKENGNTPLAIAAHFGHLEVVKELLRGGAGVNIANNAGRTPADLCCLHENADKSKKGAILAALREAAAYKAPAPPRQLPAAQRIQPWAPGPPSSASPLGTTTAKKGTYPVGLVGLTAVPSLVATALAVDSKLLRAGLSALFQVAGAVVTANSLQLLTAATTLIKQLVESAAAVEYCKNKVDRVRGRVGALCPALLLLHDTLSSEATAEGVQQRALQSLNDTLLCLFQVLLDLQHLLHRFSCDSSSAVRRMTQFLRARGYQEEFDDLDSSLQSCLGQLSCIVNISQLAAKNLEGREELRVERWREENTAALRADMQQLEGLVLQAVRGVENLERELKGQGIELRQVAEWLQAMDASSTEITAHLVQVSLQLDHLQGTVEQRFDNVDNTLQAVLAYMTNQAVPGQQQQQQQQPRPVFVIPRSEVRFSEADLAQAAGGAFGKVVKAARDQGYVAVKIYRHQSLGKRDRKRVVQEALLLARASHQNVVRCFGVVHDPDNANDPSNIDGSLVMEWVYGGDLYKWLQANDSSGFRDRLTLAAQVAAGMRYLHENRLVHGDLKPQNVMLQPSPAGGVPEAKICDFGLAKHASTTTASTFTPTTKAYTLEYTSPERLLEFTRSYQDDVYAFGILMYFIASCDSPFHNIDNSRLKDAILAGKRPDIDEWAEEEVDGGLGGLGGVVAAYCQLAKQCWHKDPGQRPSFAADIYPQLRTLLEQCP